ncbi:MAG: MFS transporter [Planctomycetota bacterium]
MPAPGKTTAPGDDAVAVVNSLGPTRTPLWRNLNFTLMWTSTAASGFGDRMMMLAALALLGGFGLAADSTQINAGTQFWFFLPYFLFSIAFGWLADHLPRKWIMLGCDEGRALVLLIAVLLVPATMVAPQVAPGHEWKVFAALFAVGTFAALFNPTRNAIIPQLVPLNQLSSANAMLLGIGVISSMVGLIVGDFIIDPERAVTVRRGLFTAVLFFSISGMFFAFLKVHRPVVSNESGKKHSFKQAAIYVVKHRRVVELIVLHVLIWGAAMVVYNSVLAIGKELFALEDKALQSHFVWMGGMLGAGMLAGAGVVVLIGTLRERLPLAMACLLVTGACVLLVALVPVRSISFTLAFGVGLFGNVVIISVITLLQSVSPNYIRGRIMGLDSTINTASSVLINLAIWKLPNADENIMIVLYVLGPLLMAIGLYYMVRGLRRGTMASAGANALNHLVRLFVLVWHRLEWTGRHHIPRTGPVILASNHTTALDPFLIQSVSPRQVRWLMLTSYRFKILEWFWRMIGPIFIDSDDQGNRVPATKQVRRIVGELKKGDCLGIFPEGGLQADDRVLKPFEHGVAATARLGKAQIVPCWIEGTPRTQSMLRQMLTPGKRRIFFGAPFSADPKASPEETTAELRRRMIALAPGPVEEAATEDSLD